MPSDFDSQWLDWLEEQEGGQEMAAYQREKSRGRKDQRSVFTPRARIGGVLQSEVDAMPERQSSSLAQREEYERRMQAWYAEQAEAERKRNIDYTLRQVRAAEHDLAFRARSAAAAEGATELAQHGMGEVATVLDTDDAGLIAESLDYIVDQQRDPERVRNFDEENNQAVIFNNMVDVLTEAKERSGGWVSDTDKAAWVARVTYALRENPRLARDVLRAAPTLGEFRQSAATGTEDLLTADQRKYYNVTAAGRARQAEYDTAERQREIRENAARYESYGKVFGNLLAGAEAAQTGTAAMINRAAAGYANAFGAEEASAWAVKAQEAAADTQRILGAAAEEFDPSFSGMVLRGAGAVASDLPFLAAGGVAGRIARTAAGRMGASPIVSGYFTTMAANAPLAMRSFANEGSAAGLVELLIPAMFGKTGLERAMLGEAGERVLSQEGRRSLARVLASGAGRVTKQSVLEGVEEGATAMAGSVFTGELGDRISDYANARTPGERGEAARNFLKTLQSWAAEATTGSVAGGLSNLPGEIKSTVDEALLQSMWDTDVEFGDPDEGIIDFSQLDPDRPSGRVEPNPEEVQFRAEAKKAREEATQAFDEWNAKNNAERAAAEERMRSQPEPETQAEPEAKPEPQPQPKAPDFDPVSEWEQMSPVAPGELTKGAVGALHEGMKQAGAAGKKPTGVKFKTLVRGLVQDVAKARGVSPSGLLNAAVRLMGEGTRDLGTIGDAAAEVADLFRNAVRHLEHTWERSTPGYTPPAPPAPEVENMGRAGIGGPAPQPQQGRTVDVQAEVVQPPAPKRIGVQPAEAAAATATPEYLAQDRNGNDLGRLTPDNAGRAVFPANARAEGQRAVADVQAQNPGQEYRLTKSKDPADEGGWVIRPVQQPQAEPSKPKKSVGRKPPRVDARTGLAVRYADATPEQQAEIKAAVAPHLDNPSAPTVQMLLDEHIKAARVGARQKSRGRKVEAETVETVAEPEQVTVEDDDDGWGSLKDEIAAQEEALAAEQEFDRDAPMDAFAGLPIHPDILKAIERFAKATTRAAWDALKTTGKAIRTAIRLALDSERIDALAERSGIPADDVRGLLREAHKAVGGPFSDKARDTLFRVVDLFRRAAEKPAKAVKRFFAPKTIESQIDDVLSRDPLRQTWMRKFVSKFRELPSLARVADERRTMLMNRMAMDYMRSLEDLDRRIGKDQELRDRVAEAIFGDELLRPVDEVEIRKRVDVQMADREKEQAAGNRRARAAYARAGVVDLRIQRNAAVEEAKQRARRRERQNEKMAGKAPTRAQSEAAGARIAREVSDVRRKWNRQIKKRREELKKQFDQMVKEHTKALRETLIQQGIDEAQEALNESKMAAHIARLAARDSLPEDLQVLVDTARAGLDQFSFQLTKTEGLVSPGVAATIAENYGLYGRRFYALFTDKKFQEQMLKAWRNPEQATPEQQDMILGARWYLESFYTGEAILARAEEVREVEGDQGARRYLSGMASALNLADAKYITPEHTPPKELIDNLLGDILRYSEWVKGQMRKQTVADKDSIAHDDLGMLMRRKDVPPALRSLLGEVTDPIARASKSAAAMISAIATNQVQQEMLIKVGGLGEDASSLIYDGDGTPPKGFLKITAPGVLKGKYAHPAIYEAVQPSRSAENLNLTTRVMMFINTLWAKGNTVYNLPFSPIRNHGGSLMMSVRNGTFFIRPDLWGPSYRAAWEGWRGKRNEMWDRAVRLGVADTDLTVGFIEANREVLDRMFDMITSKAERGKGLKQKDVFDALQFAIEKGKWTDQKMTELYQMMDNIAKIHSLEAEIHMLKEAGFTDAEAERIGAENVKQTLPTWTAEWDWVRGLRRNVLGQFATFQASMLRTNVGVYRLAFQELQDPRRKKMGAIRLTSASAMNAASTFSTQLGQRAYLLLGGSAGEGDDYDTRRAAAEFQNAYFDSSEAWVMRRPYMTDDKRVRVRLDSMAYIDPNHDIARVPKQFLSGDIGGSAARAMEIGSSFGPSAVFEIFGKSLVAADEAKRDARAQGWTPGLAAWVAGLKTFAAEMSPGVIREASRISRTGTTGGYGNVKEWEDYLIRTTGLSTRQYDVGLYITARLDDLARRAQRGDALDYDYFSTGLEAWVDLYVAARMGTGESRSVALAALRNDVLANSYKAQTKELLEAVIQGRSLAQALQPKLTGTKDPVAEINRLRDRVAASRGLSLDKEAGDRLATEIRRAMRSELSVGGKADAIRKTYVSLVGIPPRDRRGLEQFLEAYGIASGSRLREIVDEVVR